MATTFGFLMRTSSRSKLPPSRSCCFDNSSALAVAIGQMFEIPIPLRSNSVRTSGGSPHDASTSVVVMPERYNAGQNLLPGRAKWAFTAAVHSPGLMPTNRRLIFLGRTSSTVCPWNDANSCFVGRRPSMNSCRCVTAFRSLQRLSVRAFDFRCRESHHSRCRYLRR